MAEQAKTDEINVFLNELGLNKYYYDLREAGLENLAMIKGLEDDDINDLIQEAKLSPSEGKILINAIKAIKNAEYNASNKYPHCIKEEKTEYNINDEELKQLRERRKDLKGQVPVKNDRENKADGQKTRTIIFIGQTGSGKTTLINSMCNYLQRVSYDEKFRYKLIFDEKNAKISKDTTKSQTQDITLYHLGQSIAISHALTIIDTPGFGDTEGAAQDKKIRDKFENCFESIPWIDAIYFVIKATETRLSATQKYVFQMVSKLFGHDIKDNIFILFTFSDGGKPSALKSVNKLEIQYSKYFKINNCGFKLSANKQIDEMFFKLGMEEFDAMFTSLSKIESKSTRLTIENLRERDNITAWLDTIRHEVKLVLDQIRRTQQTYQHLKENKDQINANKEYKIEDQEVKIYKDKLPHNWYTTYCTVCVHTCHHKCYAKNRLKGWCEAFEWDGRCRICPKKCETKYHQHSDYIVSRKVITVYKTLNEMATKYKLATNEKANCENVIRKLKDDINQKEVVIRETIIKMNTSLNRIKELALNKNVLTDDQYFDVLIATEKEEGSDGWKDRVKQLQNLKNYGTLFRDYEVTTSSNDKENELQKQFNALVQENETLKKKVAELNDKTKEEEKQNDQNMEQLQFKDWLFDKVKLKQYLQHFEEKQSNDIRMVAFLDDAILENEIGINSILHRKLIMKEVDHFKTNLKQEIQTQTDLTAMDESLNIVPPNAKKEKLENQVLDELKEQLARYKKELEEYKKQQTHSQGVMLAHPLEADDDEKEVDNTNSIKLSDDELCKLLQDDLENYGVDQKKKRKNPLKELTLFHKEKAQIIRDWKDNLKNNHSKTLDDLLDDFEEKYEDEDDIDAEQTVYNILFDTVIETYDVLHTEYTKIKKREYVNSNAIDIVWRHIDIFYQLMQNNKLKSRIANIYKYINGKIEEIYKQIEKKHVNYIDNNIQRKLSKFIVKCCEVIWGVLQWDYTIYPLNFLLNASDTKYDDKVHEKDGGNAGDQIKYCVFPAITQSSGSFVMNMNDHDKSTHTNPSFYYYFNIFL